MNYNQDFGQQLIDREDYDFETQRQKRLDDHEERLCAAEARWEADRDEELIRQHEQLDFER